MKQYCRYCSHCSYGDIVYCKLLKKTMSEEKAKKLQKCKYFVQLKSQIKERKND